METIEECKDLCLMLDVAIIGDELEILEVILLIELQ